MRVIHKHEVGVGAYTLNIPADAELLDVQEQRGKPVLWVLGDTDGRYEQRWFKGVMTGVPDAHDVWEGWTYVGTCQLHKPHEPRDPFVLHLFTEVPSGEGG